MNRRIAIFALSLMALFLVLSAPHVLAAPDQNYSYARIVRLSYVQGDVQVQRPEETGWEDALVNLPIRKGYQISTRQGRAEIEFESGAVARLAEDTLLQFTELALADGGRLTQLSLFRGTATFYANLSSDDRFLVTTPHFNITVPRNARFRIDAADDGATVSVNKGDITVDALGASYRVTKNRAFLFRVEGEQVTLARAPDSDAWDRWVDERENILSASREAVSTRYTRTSYIYGMSDLDYYGGWYNLPGYGYGWQPRGISIGWSPYCSGRWMHVGGFLTWVSFELWGWTPYHYGHWVYVRNGWFWMPGGFNHWQPAIVYWVHLGGNRWGWGPRSPLDRPGHAPANLPHGTVVSTNNNPRGYGSVDRRFERAAPGEIARARIVSEPPESFAEGARFRGRGRSGADQIAPPTASGAAATPSAPVSGFSGTTQTPQPREASPEERPEFRTRGRAGETGAPSGIVYDPQQRRYVNSPDVPGRTSATGRTDSTGALTAPATRGYSGTTATPSESRKIPTMEVRREAPTTVIQRDENRVPGRREQPQESTPARMSPAQQPRQDAQPQPRQQSAPPPQSQPRYEQPRPAQQPHWQSQPRSTPAPQSQPRVEPSRPASPPRSESRERPATRPPKGR